MWEMTPKYVALFYGTTVAWRGWRLDGGRCGGEARHTAAIDESWLEEDICVIGASPIYSFCRA